MQAKGETEKKLHTCEKLEIFFSSAKCKIKEIPKKIRSAGLNLGNVTPCD